jgi:hypothetical protein
MYTVYPLVHGAMDVYGISSCFRSFPCFHVQQSQTKMTLDSEQCSNQLLGELIGIDRIL